MSKVLDLMVNYSVPVPMRDGTILRADVYRPTADGSWPVLLARLPYGKNEPFLIGGIDPLGLARRGYIVILQDTRGRFASEGEWEPWTFEAADGYDTVQWAAELPGSNGSVGMIGMSYFGNTQWMAALSKPPALKAIAPMITWSEPDDGLFARGGAAELGITVPWSLTQGADTILRRHVDDPSVGATALSSLIHEIDDVTGVGYWELPTDAHPAFQRHQIQELGFERSRREPGWSDACRVAGRQDEVNLPSLNVGGWYDIFCQGTLDNFMAMRAAGNEANLIMGPWGHLGFTGQLGDVNFGLGATGNLMGMRGSLNKIQSDWFSQFLRPDSGADLTPDSTLPPVLLFVMGTNEWREECEWPLSRASEIEFFLRADGRLATSPAQQDEGTDTYVYDPAKPAPTTGGALLMSSEFRPGPLDQSHIEARSDVLTYTTEPLLADTEVTGRIRAVLHVATDAPTTDWVVRLCDVDTDGVSRNIVDGIVRVVDTPGEFAEHQVDLWSTSYVFREGHRLRVHVTSSNFPRWDRNLNGNVSCDAARPRPANQEIAHDNVRRSRIILPVVPPPS